MEVADDWEGEYSLDSEVVFITWRSEEHTSELQSQSNLVCRLLLEKKKNAHVEPVPPHHTPPNPFQRAFHAIDQIAESIVDDAVLLVTATVRVSSLSHCLARNKDA